jgi:hypothetical protein
MENIEVKYKPNMTMATAYACIEDGKKVAYITDILKGAFPSFLNAVEAHERVHLKGNGNFLPDGVEDSGGDRGKIVRNLIRKYRFPELEEKLNGYPWPINIVVGEYEVAKELSHFHRQCVDLIAYSEANGEETKNWILILPYIGDEVEDFIREKEKRLLIKKK